MTESKPNKYWMLVIILLLVIIATGGIVAWLRYSPSQPVEISMPLAQEWQGRIYIGGAVAAHGSYPFASEDTIKTLLQAAGYTTAGANMSGLKLYIAEIGKEEPQKIDINHAEVWLLKAQPGIGDTLAQRIVDYRQQNGPFRNTNELTNVAGIGTATYERIKHLITVAD